MAFHDLFEIVDGLRQGEMVIMVDDEDRENEGDVIFAAQHATPEKVNFLAKHARGLICLALTPEQVDRLQLPLMVPETQNGSPNRTAFTVSVEAASGISTGISAADRSRTLQVAGSPNSGPADLIRPGHIFPLRARAGGVLERPGHTEAGVDLMRLAGLVPAAVICEVMNDDGTMARVEDLRLFAEKHGLKMGKIRDLIDYLQSENEKTKDSHGSQKQETKSAHRDRDQSL